MPERFPGPVAHPSNQIKLIPPDETNPLYDNIKENQLLLLTDENNLKKGRTYLKELFSRVENICGAKNQKNISTYLYFLENGCSFAKDLQKRRGLANQTAHRIIGKLLDNGLIFPVTKTDIHRRDGPKTTLYGVEDVTDNEVNRARTRDLQYSSKTYIYVEQLYQRTLPEIERESIQYSKIISLAKRKGGLQGFNFLDLAEQVARKHALNGVKVWR